jgi:thioredoxin-related protein
MKQVYFSLLGPLFYFLFVLLMHLFLNPQEEILKHPIVWAFVLYCLAILLAHSIKKWAYLILAVATALYALVIYPNSTYDQPFFEDEPTTETSITHPHNLSGFTFLDQSGQPINFSHKQFVLLETWHETCPPCLKSIKNLQDTLANIKDLQNFYLYQARGKEMLSNDSILNFTVIKEKSKILIDPNNELFDSLDLDAYPYFLLFDKTGKLITSRKGYAKEIEADILYWLKVNIKKE